MTNINIRKIRNWEKQNFKISKKNEIKKKR